MGINIRGQGIKPTPKSRWNLIHERWEIKSNGIWIARTGTNRRTKWSTVGEFVDSWKHEAKKDESKRSISNLAKKWNCSISEIKKQRTTINNALFEHFPLQIAKQLAPIHDYTPQQQTTKRAQSNELTADNIAALLGIERFDRS